MEPLKVNEELFDKICKEADTAEPKKEDTPNTAKGEPLDVGPELFEKICRETEE